MYKRSKSESCCKSNNDGFGTLFTSQRQSAPSNLNENIDMLPTARTSGCESSMYWRMDEPNDSQNFHAKFLESKLMAANAHIRKLEVSNESQWNNDKIQEVSFAMKEYMNEAQHREESLKTKIKQLEIDCDKKDAIIKEKMQEAENYVSKMSKDRLMVEKDLTSKINESKQNLLTKSEELKETKNQFEKTKLKMQQYEKQNILKLSEMKSNETSLLCDLERVCKSNARLEEEKNQISEEKLSLQLKVTSLKNIEMNLMNELAYTEEEKHKQYENKLELEKEITAKDSIVAALQCKNEELKTNFEQCKHAGNILSDKLERLTNESQNNTNNEMSELKNLNINLKQQVITLHEELSTKSKASMELETKLQVAVRQVNENVDRNEKITNEVHEAGKREELLKVELLKYQKNSTCDDVKVEKEREMHELKQQHCAVENRLNNEKEEAIKEMNVYKESALKSQVEIELLKSKLHENELEIQKIVMQRENETNLSMNRTSQIEKELSSYDNQNKTLMRRNEELLNHVETLKVEIERNLTQALNKQKEDDVIKSAISLNESQIDEYREKNRQLLLDVKTLEELKNKEVTELKERLSTCANNHNQSLQTYQAHCEQVEYDKQRLVESLCEYKDVIENFAIKERDYISKTETLEKECQHLSTTLFEMKTFMKSTRRDVEMLTCDNQRHQDENRRQQDENQNLFNSSERLESENVNLREKNKRLEADKTDLTNKLKEMEANTQNIEVAVAKIQTDYKQMESKLNHAEKLSIEKDDFIKNQSKEMESLFCQLKNRQHESEGYQLQCYEIIQNFEQVKNQLIEATNCNELESKHRKQVEHEIDMIKLEKQTLQVQFGKELDELKRNEKGLLSRLSILNSEFKTGEEQRQSQQQHLVKLELDLKCSKERFQELKKQYEEIKDSYSTVLKDFKNKENSLDEKSKEIQGFKNSISENNFQMREYESKLKLNQECLEKFKLKNAQLLSELQAVKEKQNVNITENHYSSSNIKDLKNELLQSHKNNSLQTDEISTLRGNIKELQGKLDGNLHKHDWVLKHDQEQANEMKYLKQTLCELQMQMLQGKEQYMRLQFQCEKLNESLMVQITEKKNIADEFKSYQSECETKVREIMSQMKQTEAEMMSLKEKNDIGSSEIERCKRDNKELKSINDLQIIATAQMQEQSLNLAKELDSFKAADAKYKQQQQLVEQKFLKLHRDLVKMVFQNKELKRERDSLKALLQTCEEEKQHHENFSNRLKTETEQLRKKLNDSNHEKQQVCNDNEAIKSRMGILKLAETSRISERNEILEKLRTNELELKALRKAKFTNDLNSKKVNCANKLNSSGSSITLNDLTRLSSDINQRFASEKPSQSMLNDIKDFLTDLSKSDDSHQIIHSTPNDHVVKPGKLLHRRRYEQTQQKQNRKNVSKLFEESNKLFVSLLDDMKNLSDEVSFQKLISSKH